MKISNEKNPPSICKNNFALLSKYYTNVEFKAAATVELESHRNIHDPTANYYGQSDGGVAYCCLRCKYIPSTCIMDEHRETEINSCRIKDFPAEMEKRAVAGGGLA